MMHYKRKLFTKSKETRSADGLKIKVYWSCSKRGCRGSVNYAQTLDPDNPDHESVFSDISEREHNGQIVGDNPNGISIDNLPICNFTGAGYVQTPCYEEIGTYNFEH